MKSTQGTPRPKDFLEEEVFPAAFGCLDSVFPELKLKRTGNGWTATDYETTKARFGARPDRVVCNRPGGFLVHGGESLSWLAYLKDGMHPTGADYVEAVKELAELAGVDASVLERELTPEQARAAEERERRGTLLETALDACRRALLTPEGAAARDYLAGRGFAEDELEGLPLGLFPRDLHKVLRGAGFTEDELAASGLFAVSQWPGRLVLGLRDDRGRLVNFAARSLSDQKPKYLYLSGVKKPDAFELDVALRSEEARRSGLVLVEGLIDPVHLRLRGLDCAAALGGNGGLLTRDRWLRLAELVKKHRVPSIVLALDADEAGQGKLLEALKNLSGVDLGVKVHLVPPAALGDHKDPDELVRAEGVDAFREALAARVPWASFYGDSLLGEVTPDAAEVDRREVVDRILDFVETLRGERSALDAESVLKTTAERTGFSFEALHEMGLSARERRTRAEAEEAAREAVRLAADELTGDANPLEVSKELKVHLEALEARAEAPPPPFSVRALVDEMAHLPPGVPTGWAAVDELGVRLRPEELVLVAGRTGHGKTTALVNLALNWLRGPTEGPLVLYSHEEPPSSVLCRLVALLAAEKGAPWTVAEVRDWLTDREVRGPGYAWPVLKKLNEALAELEALESRLEVVHRPAWSAERITAHAREVCASRGPGLVLVDYLQRLPFEGKVDRRDQEVSAAGRTLKGMAVDLGVPVVAGAQINREAVKGKLDKVGDLETLDEAVPTIRTARPQLHHLREGGSEQEADLVLGLLNFAADWSTNEEGGEVHKAPARSPYEVGVLKNRYGAVGAWASLTFEGKTGRLLDGRP